MHERFVTPFRPPPPAGGCGDSSGTQTPSGGTFCWPPACTLACAFLTRGWARTTLCCRTRCPAWKKWSEMEYWPSTPVMLQWPMELIGAACRPCCKESAPWSLAALFMTVCCAFGRPLRCGPNSIFLAYCLPVFRMGDVGGTPLKCGV